MVIDEPARDKSVPVVALTVVAADSLVPRLHPPQLLSHHVKKAVKAGRVESGKRLATDTFFLL